MLRAALAGFRELKLLDLNITRAVPGMSLVSIL
jgi:hypothetical protein